MTRRCVKSRLVLSLLVSPLLVAASACGGSSSSNSSPTSPSGTGSSTTATACRTYATADQKGETSNTGLVGTTTDTCQFNKTSNQLTCTATYSDNQGSAYSSTSVTTFLSVADYVGDAPRVFAYSTSTTHPASVSTTRAGTTTNATYTYDSLGRLTVFNAQISAGASQVLTFSAWDSFGRPTAGSDANTAYTYTYNDSARMVTTSNRTGTIAQTYDANGILVEQVSVVPGVETVSMTQTTQSTDTVCK